MLSAHEKGKIHSYVPVDINTSFNMSIIIFGSYINSIYSLPKSLLEIIREKIQQKVPDTLIIRCLLKIKHIDSKHTLQHIMQKVVMLIVLTKPRRYSQPRLIFSHKSHHVTSSQDSILQHKNGDLGNIIMIEAQRLRKDQQVRIFLTQHPDIAISYCQQVITMLLGHPIISSVIISC